MSFLEDERESRPSRERIELASEPRLLTRRDRGPDTGPRTAQRSTRGFMRILRRLCFTLVVFAIIAAVGLVVAGVWLRHSMRASLPQIDGTLHVPGLTASVTVTRNAQGVPSIRAGNIDDLLFAQGFVTAQDRLWQMDMLRRHAAGELAEILGPGLVEHDRQQRTLQLRAAADRAVQAMPPENLHELRAYARGVNAFIDAHRDRLPVEFHLLHYQPRPWSARDSILVTLAMWQELSTSFPQKLDREALSQHLPPDLLADLYPVGSWRDHPPTQQPTDLTSPRIVQQVPLDSTQSKLEVPQPTPPSANTHDLLAISHAFAPPHCNDCRSGSNNWVVSGSHSASGSPLISNDMHLALSAPDIWYEAALHAPSVAGGNTPLDVTGFTLPGVPSVLVGRNAHVAWTLTNLGGDIQDLWIEHLRGSGNEMQFEQPDGTWSSVQHHTEHIVVRGSRDVTLDILSVSHAVGSTTIETPIISRLYPTEHRALSLAWTIYDPSTLSTSLLAADASPDASSLVAAFATFGGPSLNLIYADDHGHIGYHALGRIPIRGPAVPHPRAVTPFVMPEPEPDSDEENDESQSAPAANHDSIAPTLFNPPSSQPSFSPRILLRETAYIPSTRRTRRSKIHPQQIEPQPSTPQSDQALPSPPIEQNFTIGSPLSPVPVDALNPTQQWSGYIPYDSLPAVQDPSDGILATANSRIVSDDYPYAIALSWVDPYRTERIYRLLEGRNNLTPQAMLAIQTDTHSEFDLLLAQRVAYAIDHASTLSHATNPARLRQAADILRNWQADLTPNSPAAAIVAAVHSALWSKLLIPQIIAHDHCSHSEAVKLSSLYLWGERTTALEQILTNDPARWLPATAPNWNNFLATVTDRALAAAHAPRDLSHWHYGILHTVAIDHPLFDSHSLFRWVLGVPTGSGSQPAAGDLTTIDAIGHTFGPSERLTADMSIPSATFANITTGQSGNPASPWFLDQFSSWLRGATYALPLNDTAAAHTLTLLPNS